jgi:hypothetical protein
MTDDEIIAAFGGEDAARCSISRPSTCTNSRLFAATT